MLKNLTIIIILLLTNNSQDCSYAVSFKLLELERVYPLVFAAYIDFNLSIHEELYNKDAEMQNFHKKKIIRKNDYSLVNNSIKYINGLKIILQKPIYNSEQVLKKFEILNQKFVKFDKKFFTIYNNVYILPESSIKFLLLDELCNYNLSMVSLDNIKAISTPNGNINDGTLVFTFNFDNFPYLSKDDKLKEGIIKSQTLIAHEKMLSKKYLFDDFFSFDSVKNN